MNNYQRLFGSGPTGAVMSWVLLLLAWTAETSLALPVVFSDQSMADATALVAVLMGLWLLIWSIQSLPVSARGKGLVTTGAFRYLRHPLYASALCGFNFGVALWLNNWVYLLWALLLHPVWHWHIRYEESLMLSQFGDSYRAYCSKTGRFVPRISRAAKQ